MDPEGTTYIYPHSQGCYGVPSRPWDPMRSCLYVLLGPRKISRTKCRRTSSVGSLDFSGATIGARRATVSISEVEYVSVTKIGACRLRRVYQVSQLGYQYCQRQYI